ncbi:hypothetical protein [Fuerstiella marisgermanici]|uniref:hypothetical protein n=1 Tax=Fuerstiella marisgermanici TaxID=1891926 RepID=UPI0011AB5D36|nr:hypothetical protein [Fuerstiella marisgermanici]
MHRRANDAFTSWTNYGGGGPFAAALACQAKQVDYPDMESVIWHVRLACRVKGRVTSAQDRLKSAISTARILAIADQFAARELLLLVNEQQDQIPKSAGGLSLYDQWLQAWLLVDFGRGTALLKQDLAEIAATGKKNALRYGHGDVIRLLTSTPDEHYDLITGYGTGL